MQPQDDQPQRQGEPTDPPPNELPRPRVRMNDIRPTTRPSAMNDIRPVAPVQPTAPAPVQKPTSHPGDHLLDSPHELRLTDGLNTLHPKKKRSKLKVFLYIVLTLLIAVLVAAVSAGIWYQEQLKPVDPGDDKHVRMIIQPNSSPVTIATDLKEAGLIKNELAFNVYTRVSGTRNVLKAGTFNLKPSETLPQIVDHLVAGKQDTFSLTFLPGDTLANNRKKIIEVGYEASDVDAALAKTYDRPLFAGKPASADLEGYIFGETYKFESTATVEQILEKTFDEYESYITKYDLVNAFKKQNLTLYQGLTLASIIQKEVSGPADSRQVAQVFYKRMKEGMPLGADATFVYAAKKEGRAPTVDFDSLYNTRIHKGLPPGPISVPGLNALLATADPASGDYLYFVSGDDGKNYFSRTLAEHEANTRAHCKKNCSIF